jgi:hypothetical protein
MHLKLSRFKNEKFFSLQWLQPQQVFGLRVGKSADYMQSLPAETPQVGQATEDNCFVVKSFFFTDKG